MRGEYTTGTGGKPVSARADYDPFGQPQAGNGLGAPADYGFIGEPQDSTTGQVHLRARWYTPANGQFSSRDPWAGAAEEPQTFNPYSYAGNDPVNDVDPSGWVFYGFRLPEGQTLYGQASQRVQLALDAAVSSIFHAEVPIPGTTLPDQASDRTKMSRIDFMNEATGAIWEIKPLGLVGLGMSEVGAYVSEMNNAKYRGIFGKPAHGNINGVTNDWNIRPTAWRQGLPQDHYLLGLVLFLGTDPEGYVEFYAMQPPGVAGVIVWFTRERATKGVPSSQPIYQPADSAFYPDYEIYPEWQVPPDLYPAPGAWPAIPGQKQRVPPGKGGQLYPPDRLPGLPNTGSGGCLPN